MIISHLASPEEVEAEIVKTLREAEYDLSSSEVAHKVGLSERGARKCLARMVGEDKITNTRTVCHAMMYTWKEDNE